MSEPLQTITILLVDDEAYFRFFVGKVLSTSISCTVLQVKNGQEAIDICTVVNPDLILLDINMPHVDGVQALPQLRARHTTTPIVMLTSVSEEAVVEKCAVLGASYFIRKDVRADQLQIELQEMLRRFFPNAAKAHEQTRTPQG